jgi:hypothetical protein
MTEIDEGFTLRVFDPGVADIPLFRNDPIQDLGPGGHFSNLERDVLLQDSHRRPEAVSSNAPTDGVELGNQSVDALPDVLIEHERTL